MTDDGQPLNGTVIEYGDLAEIVREQMGAHDFNTTESAAAMKALLDVYEGAIITGHGHAHVHRITALYVTIREDVMSVDVRTNPCPTTPPPE